MPPEDDGGVYDVGRSSVAVETAIDVETGAICNPLSKLLGLGFARGKRRI